MPMNEDELNKHLASTNLLIWLAALLFSLPNVIGGAYDIASPREVYLDKQPPPPSFETYETDLYKELSDKDMFFLTEGDRSKLNKRYEIAVRDHVEFVKAQGWRQLLMYGVLFVASVVALTIKFRVVFRS